MTYPHFGVAATSLVLFGCGALLGLPDDPRLSVPVDESMRGPLGAGTLETRPAWPADGVALGSAPRGSESLSDVGIASREPEGRAVSEALDGGISALPASEGVGSALDAALSEPGTPGSVAVAPSCPALVTALISDFRFAAGGRPTGVIFGPEASFAGGTYFYPTGAGLTADVTEGDWHVSGTVSGASGFGLYTSKCQLLDASAFTGLSFSLWGPVDAGQSLRLLIETAAQQVSHVWLNDNKDRATDPDVPPNAGRCFPATRRYDGTCSGSRVTFPVTETPTQIDISWLDLNGGSPVALIDPSEITAITWEFPESMGAHSVDIHIDDLRFSVP